MKELIEKILKDGNIDPEEAQELRDKIFEDGEVDKEEAEALFELNDKAEEKCPEFKDLFVDGIKGYILADDELDDDEAEFLKEHILKDGQIDENEKALLEALSEEVELPEELASLID